MDGSYLNPVEQMYDANSERTVKFHVSTILGKLNGNRTEAMAAQRKPISLG